MIRPIAVSLLALVASWSVMVAPGAPVPADFVVPALCPPDQVIDLTAWKLTLPTGAAGKATQVLAANLAAPLRLPWFAATPLCDGVVFWAPTTGATTANSAHPRTELVSLITFPAGHGTSHTLSASLRLLQQPRDGGGVIVGQIHGAKDIRSVPFVMLRIQRDQLRVVVKQVQHGDKAITYPLLINLDLSAPIDYTLTDAGDGTMTFTATNRGVTGRARAPVPAAFRDATVRFQAGDYQQASHTVGAGDGGRVVFYRLTQN